MKGIRLIPQDVSIDFIGPRFIALAFSLCLILGSFGSFFTKGLAFGIDFTGGTMIEIRTPALPDLTAMRTQLGGLGIGAVSIQEFGAAEDVLIRLPQQEGGPENQQAAITKVKAALDSEFSGGAVEYRRIEFVGPQVGEELKKAGFFAVLFSLAGILAYIWFRFEWQFGVAAVFALAHDTIATVGLFSITGMEFNLSTVAAVLMIAGYSINDTVIVFDRIRENLRKFKKKPLPEVLSTAINETLSRTVITSGTTLIALIALWAFGGEVIRGFVNALIFGIVIGTYSSVFVAAPSLLFLNVRRGSGEDTKAQVDEKAKA